MSPDIDAVNKLLKEEKVWQVVRAHMEDYHMSQGRTNFGAAECYLLKDSGCRDYLPESRNVATF